MVKIPVHRIVQLLAALAGGGAGTGVVVTDPHNVLAWVSLITGAVIGLVTWANQVFDETTPTLPITPVQPPAAPGAGG